MVKLIAKKNAKNIFLADNIKFLRKSLIPSMSQLEFGKLFGLKRSNISSYEDGRALPKKDIAKNIANYFGLKIEELEEKNIENDYALQSKINNFLSTSGNGYQIEINYKGIPGNSNSPIENARSWLKKSRSIRKLSEVNDDFNVVYPRLLKISEALDDANDHFEYFALAVEH